MKRSQSILITSVLVAGIVSFSLGWFFAKNIEIGSMGAKIILPVEEKVDPVISPPPLKIRDIDEVWKKLQNSYYNASKLDQTKLEYSAVRGFVEGIGDDYTVFMDPQEAKDFDNGLEGQLQGIGAQLEMKDGKLIVLSPLKNSPAEKAGIKAKDTIYKIDGKRAADMTLYEAIRAIRGKKGTTVILTVVHEGQTEPIDIPITRDDITIDTITTEKLDSNILHVSINQFNDHTKTEFENIIQRVLLEKPRGLILDVRGNGGGFLDTAVTIISEFIPDKKTAVIIKQRDPQQNKTMQTSGEAPLSDIPLVMLVDKGSASASEILAGALQDYKRAILIGEKTFGKGSVQEVDKLADGSSLRYTIAKWFTPLERSIDGVGIVPDKEVKMTDDDIKQKRDPQLDEAVRYLKRTH